MTEEFEATKDPKHDISVLEQQYRQSDLKLIDQLLYDVEKYGQVSSAQETDIKCLIDFCQEFYLVKSEPTIRQMKDFKRRIKASRKEEDVFDWYKIENKRSAYIAKACLKAIVITRVWQCIKLLSRLQRAAGPARDEHLESIKNYAGLVRAAREHGVFDKRSRGSEGRWLQYRDANLGKKGRRKSRTIKRNISNKLPDGWQEKLAKAMTYDPVLDLLIVTGLRTAEINTARLEVNGDGLLVVNLRTAKTPKDEAVRSRRLTLNPDIPSVKRLFLIRDTFDFSAVKTEPFRLRLGNVSVGLFSVRISPRVFRHEVASLFKQIDGPMGTRISVAMGHGSTQTSCAYGAVRGKRTDKVTPNPIVEATSSEPVRETRSMTYRKKDKKAEPDISLLPSATLSR